MDRPELSPAPVRADAPREVPPPYAPALPGGTAPRPRRRWRWLTWLILLILLGVLLLVLWRIFGPSPQGGAARHAKSGEGAQPVGVAKIGRGNMQVVLTGLGTVTPLATITVQTQISGQLMAVGYKEGQMVKKGDLLAQIDPRPYDITLQSAEGTLAHDEGLLAQAKSDLARYIMLAKRNSIATQTVTDQQFLVQQDEGTVQVDQAAVNSAKLNLAYCRITSPVNGRVGLRLVDPGNYVQTSSATGLVVVTQLDPISVVFVLPEDNIPAVAQQMHDQAQPLTVTAYDRTNTNVLATGTLMTVDNTVDTTTGTVKLRASFPNANFALFPNQFVNAQLLLSTLSNVVRAPTAAVQHGAPGTFVYLVKPDGTVGVQVIKAGVTDGEYVQVLSGLNAGDQVVVDGADRLKDGAKVRVQPDASDQAATPNTGPGAPPGEQPDNAQKVPGQQQHHHRRPQAQPAEQQ
jgi:multidrug efflux system membrane fusion protein